MGECSQPSFCSRPALMMLLCRDRLGFLPSTKTRKETTTMQSLNAMMRTTLNTSCLLSKIPHRKNRRKLQRNTHNFLGKKTYNKYVWGLLWGFPVYSVNGSFCFVG